MAAPAPAPSGHFAILYFATASAFTGKTGEHLPAPVRAGELFDVLGQRYPGIREEVLTSCAVTVNLDYVEVADEGARDRDRIIVEGDEVAIIPPVSAG